MSPSTLKFPPRPQPDWPWPAEEVTQLRKTLTRVRNILRKERLVFLEGSEPWDRLAAAVARCERLCQEALRIEALKGGDK